MEVRAKFKSAEQLIKDTYRFKKEKTLECIESLPDKVRVQVEADGQIGYGVLDLNLYVLDSNGVKYSLDRCKHDFISFESEEESIKDIVDFNFKKLKESGNAKKVFDTINPYEVYLEVYSHNDTLASLENFGAFKCLRFTCILNPDTENNKVFAYNISHYGPNLERCMKLCTVCLNDVTGYKLVINLEK